MDVDWHADARRRAEVAVNGIELCMVSGGSWGLISAAS
jgi:hypothetical protein